MPAGWIKTNDSWNPTSCGNPSEITYNVCTITQYANLPLDSQLTVCADAPGPNGWVVTNTAWDPTSPDISQAEKFKAVFGGQMPLNFQAGRQVREKVSKVALTFGDWRVNFMDKFIADRFSSVVIP